MAKILSFPEDVNRFNISKLKKLIHNGSKYPGVNNIVDSSNRARQIDRLTNNQLKMLSSSLDINLDKNPKIVRRHLLDDDMIIFNRQPTLHKPSMMGFKIKVHSNSQTVLRMHYANCATFNADFDGDEMNLHVPQNLQSKVEIKNIMHSSQQ